MSSSHVCPWWFAYTFDNPLRRIFHKPERMLSPYVKEGMTVLDAGCGMGYFSIGMARMVGDSGRVIAIDLQERMLAALGRRAARAAVSERIVPRLCEQDNLGVAEPLDFALAFWVVHETPDRTRFLSEIANALKPGGRLLITEPLFHVNADNFNQTLQAAASAGLRLTGSPRVAFSRTAILEKPA